MNPREETRKRKRLEEIWHGEELRGRRRKEILEAVLFTVTRAQESLGRDLGEKKETARETL